jgi:ornithine carbamoyltransferase
VLLAANDLVRDARRFGLSPGALESTREGRWENIALIFEKDSTRTRYNGLTDEWHPTQMLADFLTFREHIDKPLSEVTFCYLGDARFNMADSYLVAERNAYDAFG